MFTEIVSSKTASRSTSIDVSEVVLSALSAKEQPLRTIRARVADELEIHESAATTRVSRVLTNLVSQGKVERPRRGFYQLAVPKPRQPEPESGVPEFPWQLARPLAANPLQQRPQRPKAQKPQPTLPAKTAPVAQEVLQEQPSASRAPVATPVQPEAVQLAVAPPSVSRPLAERQELPAAQAKAEPADPVALVDPAETVVARPTESVAIRRRARHADKVRSRRERNWTSKGTMGAQGMVLIILWFVASGVALFTLNNSYGVAVAVGIGLLLWFLNFAMKPRRRTRT